MVAERVPETQRLGLGKPAADSWVVGPVLKIVGAF